MFKNFEFESTSKVTVRFKLWNIRRALDISGCNQQCSEAGSAVLCLLLDGLSDGRHTGAETSRGGPVRVSDV